MEGRPLNDQAVDLSFIERAKRLAQLGLFVKSRKLDNDIRAYRAFVDGGGNRDMRRARTFGRLDPVTGQRTPTPQELRGRRHRLQRRRRANAIAQASRRRNRV